MNTTNAADSLKAKILKYNEEYRKGTPLISDYEFDRLLDEYKELTEADPSLYKTLRETLFERGGKIKHPFIMGSLEKIKAEDENSVTEWAAKNVDENYLVMAKIDGISCRLKYKNGELVEAATRGDGYFGEDILDKVEQLEIPKFINQLLYVPECNIRGELVITEEDFPILNEESNNKFKNSRNATAGIINRKSDPENYIKYVSFFAYEIMNCEYSRFKQLNLLDGWRFNVVDSKVIDKNDINNNTLLNIYETLLNKVQYGIDGLVVCPYDYTNENKKIPDHMIAFKTNTLKATAKVIDVDWGVPSKDGKLTPVISISPVELGGSVIQNVTAYNAEWLKCSHIHYGSDVVIMKSGDIIPKIVEVVPPSKDDKVKVLVDIEIPEVCPTCKATLKYDGVDLVCPNTSCPSRTLEQAYQFVKKLGIKNVAKKTLNNIGLNSIELLLDETQWTCTQPSIKKFYKELKEKLYSASLKKLISCCNFIGLSDISINKIWDVVADYIPQTPTPYMDYYKELRTKLMGNLPKGIGINTAYVFLYSIHNNLELVWPIVTSKEYSPIVDKKNNIETIGSIVFTGALNTLSRKEATTLAEKAGYKVLSAVNSTLTYLVSNDKLSNSSKTKKAKEFNIPIISEDEFLQLIKGKDTTVESSLDNL